MDTIAIIIIAVLVILLLAAVHTNSRHLTEKAMLRAKAGENTRLSNSRLVRIDLLERSVLSTNEKYHNLKQEADGLKQEADEYSKKYFDLNKLYIEEVNNLIAVSNERDAIGENLVKVRTELDEADKKLISRDKHIERLEREHKRLGLDLHHLWKVNDTLTAEIEKKRDRIKELEAALARSEGLNRSFAAGVVPLEKLNKSFC